MWNDIRFVWKNTLRSPMFTVVAVLSLALGIGASTAIFSLLYQVAFRLLPVRDPAALVVLQSEGPSEGWTRRDNNWTVFSYPMYRELRDRNQALSGITGRTAFSAVLGYNGQSAQAVAEVVAGDFFGVLGLNPGMGRLLTPADETGANPVIVLGYDYWANKLAADPAVLNRQMLMNGHPVLVAGVTPKGFRGVVAGQTPDFYTTVAMMPQVSPGWKRSEQVDAYWLNIIGRLKPGVDGKRAAAAMQPLYRAAMTDQTGRMERLTAKNRQQMIARPLTVEPAGLGLNGLREQWQSPLVMLLVMVGLLLLIACANVASLLLVRAVARQRELALRFALGASRWQVARQLLIESLAIALAGGLAGLLLCQDLAGGLLRLLPADATGGWLAAQRDPRLVAFSLGVALLTGVVFGLAPILRAMRPDLAAVLRQQSSGMVGAGQTSRTRQAFVAAQICLSVLLLLGAGLFTRTLLNLVSTDPGFRADGLLTFFIEPGVSGASMERTMALYHELDQRLARAPGVRQVAQASFPPFGGWNWGNGVKVPGARQADSEYTNCGQNAVGPGYFRTFGTPLLRGREFDEHDTANSPKVAIVNETLARALFGEGNAVGRHLVMGATDSEVEIVGVVKPSKYGDVREKPTNFLYVPFAQESPDFTRQSAFFLRTQGNNAAVIPAVREILQQVDPNVPVERASPCAP